MKHTPMLFAINETLKSPGVAFGSSTREVMDAAREVRSTPAALRDVTVDPVQLEDPSLEVNQ